MSSNAASFRVEVSHVDDPQVSHLGSHADAHTVRNLFAHAKRQGTPVREMHARLAEGPGTYQPFSMLAGQNGRPLRIAILSDFVRIPYANGAAFQTRALCHSLRQCGHEVTIIGPHDPDASVDELSPGIVELPSVPLKTYPGLHIPMPFAPWVFDPDGWDFDICFAQTTSLLVQFGVWLRKVKGTPLLCVNTTHLAAAYDVLLPERLSKLSIVHSTLERALRRPFEQLYRDMYNESDGLVVLSDGLCDYWRERGVKVPIYVVPRMVPADVFDRPLGADPYAAALELAGISPHGPRLLCAGRHTREKSQDRVIRIFAKEVLPREPNAVLALIGHGPETELYRRTARDLGVERRVLFTGEVPYSAMPDFYRYADIFVHTSLSETYGNVLGEALWCGMPVVAMADKMGASFQVIDGVNGRLIDPHVPSEAAADAAFGSEVVALLRDPIARRQLAQSATRLARARSSRAAVDARLAEAFGAAQQHAKDALARNSFASKRSQLRTTLSHVRPWATIMGGVYLAGHLRRPTPVSTRGAKQPTLGA